MILLSMLACSETVSTPAGSLGSPIVWDLPSGAPAAPKELQHHEQTAPICAQGALAPATVKFSWSTFTVESDSYIVEVSAEIVKPGEKLEVVLEADGMAGSSSLEAGTWTGMAMVDFKCRREAWIGWTQHSEQLADFVYLKADGTVESPKAQ